MSNHLYDAFVAAIPGSDRTAIHLSDGGRVSYGQFFGLAERLSSHLVRRGVLPGDRVAVQVEKSWESLALYLACVRAGAVFLPLNTAYPLSELDYFIGDAQPSFVVAQPGTIDGVRELCGKRGQRSRGKSRRERRRHVASGRCGRTRPAGERPRFG